jgi:ABC-type multidrug transport system ATPase subunit
MVNNSSPVITIDLKKTKLVTIGRSPDNDVIFDHPLVSRYHAKIERVGDHFILLDLESTNGVFVNEQRITHSAQLKDHARIRIGPYVISIEGWTLKSQIDMGLGIKAIDLQQQVARSSSLLKNITLTIEPMSFVAIVGPSGSGKTTLLSALCGFRPSSAGQVLINGLNLYQHYDIYRNDIGYVPQQALAHPELTAEQALLYTARLRLPADIGQAERQSLVKNVLYQLGLHEHKDIPIYSLSGGEAKRVSIGVELLSRPRLLFLDEPTSGLDPDAEYELMRLLRQLADNGHTVVIVTHASQNINLCDKVACLAPRGYLAFYGAPDAALAYFDRYRTVHDRRQKELGFDDIYRTINDRRNGSPEEWGSRYRSDLSSLPQSQQPSASAPRSSASFVLQVNFVTLWQQIRTLSERDMCILLRDRVSAALMLATAPLLGSLDFVWGRTLYDPVMGDATKIMAMWFMTTIVALLVGALSSIREIVKEKDIYRRERANNLSISAYLASKLWIGVLLALYQAGILLMLRIIFVAPPILTGNNYWAVYISLFLGVFCGYALGLVISAGAVNQNAAILIAILVLIPQFMFAGALLPLDAIPGGKIISLGMPSRWIFEALVRSSGFGDQLAKDPCWAMPIEQRLTLTDQEKQACPCTGKNIFTSCTDFPGILSPRHYNPTINTQLTSATPTLPALPTSVPFPTAYPSPTPFPTPELPPIPTPDLTDIASGLTLTNALTLKAQGELYLNTVIGQIEAYSSARQIQGEEYARQLAQQGREYLEAGQAQTQAYITTLQDYNAAMLVWQQEQQKALRGAELTLESINTAYRQVFSGTVSARWGALGLIGLVLLVCLSWLQKRKDVF